MTDKVLLHIGAMKTGTSYLQAMLGANHDNLLEAGIMAPTRRSAPVHDLIDFTANGEAHLKKVRGTWDELLRQTRQYDGRAMVFSHEYLSLQGPTYVKKTMESLADFDVHVVITVRDATGTLPAQWQTSARNKGTMTWPEYAEAARTGVDRVGSHTFLYSQRIHRMARLWGSKVGPEKLHMVTVPRRGTATPGALWERFAEVIDVDPAAARVSEVPANPSASYATAHLLCLLHSATAAAGLPRREVKWMAVYSAGKAAEQPSTEPPPPLDRPTLRFAARWNGRVRRTVNRSGARLVGSLEDLPVEPDLAKQRPMALPEEGDVIASAGVLADALAIAAPSPPTTRWGSVDEAVSGLVDLMDSIIRDGKVSMVKPKGPMARDLEEG